MSAYVVLARKWRPAQFSDIVGQTHIVKTLTNAVLSKRIHHAYLFTGSRGIGKTSIARIFAKVIRCENVQEQNGMLRSCDQCFSCKEITAGNSVDVIEIDGASNNGVEAVREIRENAKYMPSSGSRKIYIIDEVHMLTTAAFNALLKTLEEPPPHVLFIFATTEPHKIPATILSRCQRFDYRRVTVSQIQTRMSEIIQAEGVDAEPGTLPLIARAAEGSMRDALSLLDQVIAFAGIHLSVQSVRESIGLIEGQTVLGILKSIFERNAGNALQFVEQTYQQGHDLRMLTRSLIEFLHATLLTKVSATHSGSLELSTEEWDELKAIANLRSIEEIELIFQVLHQGLEWIARSPQPKVVLDVLIVKCATADALIYFDSVASAQSKTPNLSQTQKPAAVQPTPLQSAPSQLAQAQAQAQPETQIQLHTQAAAQALAPIPPLPNPSQPIPPSPLTASPPTQPSSASSAEHTLENFITHIRKSRPLLASILEHSCNTQLPNVNATPADNTLLICFNPHESYFKDQLQSRIYQEQLSSLAKEFFGIPVRLLVELKDSGESLAARKEREQKEKLESAKQQAQNHPILREAKSLFGGDLGPIDVNLKGGTGNYADLST